MNIGAMLGFHDELIFWPLIDQRKVAIEYKSRAGRRMRMRMGRRMNIVAMPGFHDELIFWPLIDLAKSSNRIQIKSGKKNENGKENGKENGNENENVKENEYDGVSSAIHPLLRFL